MFLRLSSGLLIPLLSLFLACGETEKITLTIAAGATGTGLELTVAGVQRFMEQHPGIQVHVAPIPGTLSGRQSLYELLFQRRSDEIDVFQIDVVWVGMFAEHAVDLHPYVPSETLGRHFPSLVANNIIDEKLVALPWFTDAPLFFYRTDLLSKYGYNRPPETWDDLEVMARKIADGEREAGNLSFWGYIWQGRPYEGLTCNALEWQYSHGGGNFINEQGKPNLSNAGAVAAFQRVAAWVGDISPLDVTTLDEEESRLFWQRGNAAFTRNWPSAYAPVRRDQAMVGRFDVAPLPAGPDGRVAVVGGWQLMVSAYSKRPDEAAALVRFLTDPVEQKHRAIDGAYMPTIESLYQDQEIIEALPFIETFKQVQRDLVARPSTQTGAKYAEVSKVYWNAVFDILHGSEVKDRLAEAENDMAAVLGNGSARGGAGK